MNLINRLLQVASFFTSFCEKKRFKIPEEYKIVHCDTFNKIDFNYWIDYGERGYLQTNDLADYWNNHDAMKVENNTLIMWTEHKPLRWTMDQLHDYQRNELHYKEIDGNPVGRVIDIYNRDEIDFVTQNDIIEIPFVRGKLESKNGYKYGIFKVDVMLPVGKYLHPSFWLCGIESWPPEIDMFEYYTVKDSIEPNVHYDTASNHKWTGAPRIAMRNKHDEWHEIVGWWEKDFIKIYYDGRLVYKITDKEVLKWFDKEQRVILTCSIDNWKYVHNFPSEPTKQPVKYRNLEIYQK